MSQIIPTTNDIITDALFLIGELGTAETPDAFMLRTGLQLINENLNKWTSDSIYIPFLTTLNFDLIIGQSDYTVAQIPDVDIVSDKIIDLSFANYSLPASGSSQLIYPLKIISKAEFYNVTRQNNITSRPMYIFLNKQADVSILTVWPIPNQAYPCTVRVKTMLDSVAQQDSMGGLPPYYYGLLKYVLAQEFTAYYPSANWTPMMQAKYEDYLQTMKNVNETDLTINPSALLLGAGPYYWQNIYAYP